MSKYVPTIASGAIHKLLGMLEAHGIDPGPVRSAVDLPSSVLSDREGRIPIAVLHDAWEAALPLLRRDDASVSIAQTYVPGDYGIVGFVAMNAPDLRRALGHVIRYAGLWTDEPQLELADDCTLRALYRTAFPDRLGVRVATEAAMTETLHAARLLTRQPVCPLEVRFRHPAPSDTRGHEAFFGTPVLFSQADSAMVFDESVLALELPKADAMLGQYLQRIADEALKKRGGGEPSFEDRVRAIVAEEIPRGLPSLAHLARRLGTSERTLRRRLEESGTSYRELLERARADLAQGYLKDPSLSSSEVAFLLGFAEPSAFFRAFKRWTGKTPNAFRSATGA